MKREFELKAERFTPPIFEKEVFPIAFVDFIENGNCYQNTEKIVASEKEYYNTGDKICMDFGRHITGYFQFRLGQYKDYLDAPVRLKIKFAETPYEMHRDFSTYDGALCSSWLQEDYVTLDTKGDVKLSRRWAFRYVEISVIATPHPVTLSDFTAISQTSADYSALSSLKPNTVLEGIDRISLHTLSECMQQVFEDGPKRDRRLWIGDFRLQALTNYYTFNNIDIVRHCLYLFAAFDSEATLLPSYLYTSPCLETGNAYLVTYALFYVVTVCDYYEHTGDKELAEELYPILKRQIELTKKMLDSNGILQSPENYGWWTFIDWADVEPVTATMGVYIYTLNSFCKLCERLGKKKDAAIYTALANELKHSSLKHLYDGNVFRNGYDKNQSSVHSQVWMILADVVTGEDARRILRECIGNSEYLSPVTPYMHHYVLEALFKSQMVKEGIEYMIDYWGEMMKLGADTFWEAFVKGDPYVSPYSDPVMNSACHAWSCTPSYFIRKYNLTNFEISYETL